MDRDDDGQWSRLALLADPVRRSVYALFGPTGELTREDVARGAGISPALAGHHLTKLTAADLLERRPGVARGNEGRPPASYRRGRAVQLPGRRPELLTDLLAGAGRPDLPRVRAAAVEHGRSVTPRQGGRRSRAVQALSTLGFAPRSSRSTIESGGCPFVARELAAPETACEVALSLAEGVASQLDAVQVERVEGGACCVRLVLSSPGKQRG